mgnify:CR=1 FL=1
MAFYFGFWQNKIVSFLYYQLIIYYIYKVDKNKRLLI